jgi:hypothetical protein
MNIASVFCTENWQGGQDHMFQFQGGLVNNGHTLIYPSLGPYSEVIALRLAEWYWIWTSVTMGE